MIIDLALFGLMTGAIAAMVWRKRQATEDEPVMPWTDGQRERLVRFRDKVTRDPAWDRWPSTHLRVDTAIARHLERQRGWVDLLDQVVEPTALMRRMERERLKTACRRRHA